MIFNVRVSKLKKGHRCMLPVLTQIGVVFRGEFCLLNKDPIMPWTIGCLS